MQRTGREPQQQLKQAAPLRRASEVKNTTAGELQNIVDIQGTDGILYMVLTPLIIITLLGTGIALGFISGLLGIGGGIIMTPVQYWLYTSLGIEPDLAIKMSFATTLAVILPTAASGVWRHQRQGNIHWKVAIYMGLFTSAASYIGATIAVNLPGAALKAGFGILGLIVAIRMVTVKISDEERPIRQNLWLWIGLAIPIGIITGILGIGGGIFVVPILVLVLRFRMRNAVATSLAMMLFTSVGGIAGYIINGLNVPGLPDYTLGYVYWPAWIALTIGAIVMAQAGALVANKVPGRVLNYILVALMFYISLDMLGVFSWIIGRF